MKKFILAAGFALAVIGGTAINMIAGFPWSEKIIR